MQSLEHENPEPVSGGGGPKTGLDGEAGSQGLEGQSTEFGSLRSRWRV